MRKVSRDYVFKLVFEYTFYGEPNADSLELSLADCELDDEDRAYIEKTYKGITEQIDALRIRIGRNLERYKIERLYRPDYVALLLGTYELGDPEIPDKVAVNEAVDLAKKYGTEKSGAFVNGVLARILNEENR